MSDHSWIPVEADTNLYGDYQFVFRNELGEEYVHVIDSFFEYDNPRACCCLNPGMKANTLFSRSLFFHLFTISDRLNEHIVI